MEITFTDISGIVSEEFYPTPASKSIPDWYKNLSSYVGGRKVPNGSGETTGTIKRCMPVFDALTAGYIIYTPTDIFVNGKDLIVDKDTGETEILPRYEWPNSNWQAASFHDVKQAPTHPLHNGFPYPKLINPWAVFTPKGYSCFFMQPTHRQSVFTILPGVVDTDEYRAPVNFPFVINDPAFEGLIPAGSPMAQVIPFKRDDWFMKIGSEKDSQEAGKSFSKLKAVIFDSYKTRFRQEKIYK